MHFKAPAILITTTRTVGNSSRGHYPGEADPSTTHSRNHGSRGLAGLALGFAIFGFATFGCEHSQKAHIPSDIESPLDGVSVPDGQVDGVSVTDGQVDGVSILDGQAIDSAEDVTLDANQDASDAPSDPSLCYRGGLFARCCGDPRVAMTSEAVCDTDSGAWRCADGTAFVMEPWQSCGPNLVTDSDVEIGVPCHVGLETRCEPPLACVQSVTTHCQERDPVPTHYRMASCDGPEDCGGGACCLTDERGTSPLRQRGALYRTDCASECAGVSTTLCNQDTDCPEGEVCCNGPSRFPGRAGLCHASCFP